MMLSSATSYRVVAELGRGGMGTVFLSLAEGAAGFERLVAVKQMHGYLVKSPQAVQRFLNEARLAAHVHHANVVGIQRVGGDDENYFLVLDYVDGESLDLLARRAADAGGAIPIGVVLRIVLDALAGLGAVHDAVNALGEPLGILHRDVTPQNVLVGRDGAARLADFGLAKTPGSNIITDPNYAVGKAMYSAPEYLRREPVGPELDVYALGVTLWTVLAGHEPYPDHTESQLIHRVLLEGIPPLELDCGRIPGELSRIVAKACAAHPEERFRSAAEMARAISRMDGGISVATHGEVSRFVEAVFGNELARRRRRMADALERARARENAPTKTFRIRASMVQAVLRPEETPGEPRRSAPALSSDWPFPLCTPARRIALSPASTMAAQPFTKNYSDHSNDTGFQFEFFCDKCGSGHRSAFQTNSLGVAAQLLKAAGALFGGGAYRAGWGADHVKDAFRGPAWDAAFKKAVEESRPKFKQCSKCGKWVCPEVCWNHARGQCEECAPDLREHAVAAQAQVAVDQTWESARKVDQMRGMDVQSAALSSAAQCPACQASLSDGARFCPGCGTAVAAKAAGPRFCSGCGTQLPPGARFCQNCGGNVGS